PAPLLPCTPRPPPSSPLSPYTTLFRSRLLGHAVPRHLDPAHPTAVRPVRPVADAGGSEAGDGRRDGAEVPRPRTRLHRRPRAGEDRKSTRLNSSHVSISYAVFCLKKKR